MATMLDKLIDLPLLTYYDEKIKSWTAARIDKTLSNIVFITKETLPPEGKEDVLYVTEGAILIWNGTEYVEVGNPQSVTDATLWGKF